MMKRILIIAAVSLGMSSLMVAQKNKAEERFDRKARIEQYESMKMAHITSELELTPEEAQKFWPVYNQWNEKKRALREAHRPDKRVEEMTEAEAEAFLESVVEQRREMSAIEDAMIDDLQGVLPAQKIVRLLHVEKNFHKSMVRKMREKRGRFDRDRIRGERYQSQEAEE